VHHQNRNDAAAGLLVMVVFCFGSERVERDGERRKVKV
jgi:hypothetical protein